MDKLHQFTERIEVCLGKLSEDKIWTRGGENENAVGNLVMHLTGNLGQWILAGLGGEPLTRDRDGEFDARGGAPSAALMAELRAAVERSIGVISGLSEEQLTGMHEIQKYQVSGVQAVIHVVEHFAMHTGQIIFATKVMTGEDLGFYRHLRRAAQHGQGSNQGLP